MPSEIFNVRYGTKLPTIASQELRAYDFARIRNKGSADIRNFSPIVNIRKKAIVQAEMEQAAVLAETEQAAVLGTTHAVSCSCDDNHDGPCVDVLLQQMQVPDVKVMGKVTFMKAWAAFVEKEKNISISSADIKTMAFVEKKPSLGFDIGNADMVREFINRNTFKKKQLNEEFVTFMDGHVENGEGLRANIRALEGDRYGVVKPLLIKLKR